MGSRDAGLHRPERPGREGRGGGDQVDPRPALVRRLESGVDSSQAKRAQMSGSAEPRAPHGLWTGAGGRAAGRSPMAPGVVP